MSRTKDLSAQPLVLETESGPEREENKDQEPAELLFCKISKLEINYIV